MAEKNIREFLETHPDFNFSEKELDDTERNEKLAKTKSKQLKEWLATIDESNRSGVRQAWLVGRVLNAQRAKVPKGKGNVARWEKKKVFELGKEARTLQLYRQVAKGLDDPKIATALRKSHLDDGVNAVVQRIRNVRRYGEPNPVKKESQVQSDPGDILIKGVKSTIKKAMRLDDKNSKRKFVMSFRRLAENLRREVMPHDLRFIKDRFENGRPYRHDVMHGLVPYPGGKSKQVNDILSQIGHPARGNMVYVDPFVGAGSVVLNVLRRGLAEWIWINDADPATAAMWNAIIHHADELMDMFREKGTVTRTDAEKSVDLLAQGSKTIRTVELAYHAIVVHRTSFGGMTSSDKKGQSRLLSDDFIQKRCTSDKICHDIDQANWLLSRCAIWKGKCTCMDAIDVLKHVPQESIVYLDPPYYQRGSENYRFNVDHQALAKMLSHLSVPWVMSYDDCEEVRRLYGLATDPPVRETLPGDASENEIEEVLTLKRSYTAQDGGYSFAKSVMVKYTISKASGGTWMPDLRICSQPLWYMKNEALLDFGFSPRVAMDVSGTRQVMVPLAVAGESDNVCTTVPIVTISGAFTDISPEDDPSLLQHVRDDYARENEEYQKYLEEAWAEEEREDEEAENPTEAKRLVGGEESLRT